MGNPSNIAQSRVQDLIEAIGGNHISPGAGAAGAVTLALAAACTAKAVVISLAHHPDHALLQSAKVALNSTAGFALMGADRDAESFAAFVKQHTPGSIDQVIREGDRIGHLIDILSAVIEKVAPHVASNMTGDLIAARALTQAARRIQLTNAAEAREEKAQLNSGS